MSPSAENIPHPHHSYPAKCHFCKGWWLNHRLNDRGKPINLRSATNACIASKKFFNVATFTTSAGLSPNCLYTCASAVAPKRFFLSPKSTNNKRLAPLSVRNWGVTVLRTSSTRAKDESLKKAVRWQIFSRRFLPKWFSSTWSLYPPEW